MAKWKRQVDRELVGDSQLDQEVRECKDREAPPPDQRNVYCGGATPFAVRNWRVEQKALPFNWRVVQKALPFT